MGKKDFVDELYNRLSEDLEYRSYVINNPNKAMAELHDVDIEFLKNVKFEIIEEEENTITILIPTKPDDYAADQTQRVKTIANQTVDFLYERGITGCLIPNDDLRWVLLNMRKMWGRKEKMNI